MATQTLTGTLRQVRKARRLSQLELSLRLGISQRHVSFVEGGRAKPSRELLMAWLQELQAPMAVCNEAMLQAGYAPVYSATPLEDPALKQVNDALAYLLQTHDPMPALVLDAHWNLLSANRGGHWLAATLAPWAVDLSNPSPLNLLDLLIHPKGPIASITNLAEVGPPFLSRLRYEATLYPALEPKVDAFSTLLADRLGKQNLQTLYPQPAAPVLTTRYGTEYGELAFFGMFTTFGTPQDITLASLRVEHMFAADEVTRAVLRAQVQ